MSEIFKNIVAIHPWLEKQGYKVTLKTLYNHRNKKKWLVPDENGNYTLEQVKKYADKRLSYKSAVISKKREEKISEKEKEDLRLTKAKADAEEFKLSKEKKENIPRAEVDMEAAAKAIALYSEIKGEHEVHINEIIEVAGGEEKNAVAVLGLLIDIINRAMNNYASGKLYKIETDVEKDNI